MKYLGHRKYCFYSKVRCFKLGEVIILSFKSTQEIMLNPSRNSQNNICRLSFCIRTNLYVWYFEIRFLETLISSEIWVYFKKCFKNVFPSNLHLLFRCSIVMSRTGRRRSTWRWRPAIGGSRRWRTSALSPSPSRMSMTIRRSLTEQTTKYLCPRWGWATENTRFNLISPRFEIWK